MDGEKSSEGGSDAEVMRGLLEKANKMLKGLSTKPAESDRLELMQKQLDELKKMKVLRLTRLSTGPAQGLLDSGATNPLRGRTAKDDMSKLEDVWVSLATGARVPMKITKSGVMVSEDEMVEPIVPLGMVGGPLGYEVVFKNGGCQIIHPMKGKVLSSDEEWMSPDFQGGSFEDHRGDRNVRSRDEEDQQRRGRRREEVD